MSCKTNTTKQNALDCAGIIATGGRVEDWT